MKVRVKITGRQYPESGSIPEVLELPEGASLDEALSAVRAWQCALGPGTMVAVCGEHLGTVADHRERTLREGDEVLIFSPVAGG